MDTESADRSWLEPVAIVFAMLVPGLIPVSAPQSTTISWLFSGASQSLSQCILLIVIIGARGHLREYGAVRPRANDVIKALVLLVMLILVSRASAILGSWVGLAKSGGVAYIRPRNAFESAAFLGASAIFSITVAYREELFYRVYVLSELRRHGARQGAAILVSTLLFATGHAYQGPVGVLSSLMVGTLMAVAATRGFKLHALAMAHATYNFGVLASLMDIVP
ncbi:MAG: CPBP family intramembrane glutamic endopeptidase [Spirochaetia bacterium]|jgi:membrane protease YdiL (CAAX protease family)|nr:CPBP family intramembrane glutamic endopeptidase [Spirochaetia bacterium]